MSKPDRAAPSRNERESEAAQPADRDREFLDYLIERAWQTLIRKSAVDPTNDNHATKRAA